MFTLQDYQYDLPDDRIAQYPIQPADQSKLLIYKQSYSGGYDDSIENTIFAKLGEKLGANDALFFNDTKVIKASIPLHNVAVTTHMGREVMVEQGHIFFLEKLSDNTFEGLISLLKRTRPGVKITITQDIQVEITALTDSGVVFRIDGMTVEQFLATYGHMPLPPYIETTIEKESYYQTVFAQHEGSVATPTASLHFTPSLLEQLKKKSVAMHYLTLHVGLGTFKPVDTPDIRAYHIHEEALLVSVDLFHNIATLKTRQKRCVAVGTTVARTLESLPYFWKIFSGGKSALRSEETIQYRDDLTDTITHNDGEKHIVSYEKIDEKTFRIITRIFIYPGFQWRVIDSLITNFHVSGSSLLMLVAAAMGYENMKKAYQYALSHEYRFFSFGDAMWIDRVE